MSDAFAEDRIVTKRIVIRHWNGDRTTPKIDFNQEIAASRADKKKMTKSMQKTIKRAESSKKRSTRQSVVGAL